jgi:hypothetical protein
VFIIVTSAQWFNDKTLCGSDRQSAFEKFDFLLPFVLAKRIAAAGKTD